MKEQIEERRAKIHNILNNFHSKIIVHNIEPFIDAIEAIIPNNDWLEYSKHKPSEGLKYNCAIQELTEIVYETGYYSDNAFWFSGEEPYLDNDVIAFKPIPVEPFLKPKNKYAAFLEDISILGNLTNKGELIRKELLGKIENGDLK